MSAFDYNKIFNNLSHLKALSKDNKFDEIVQYIILYSLYKNHDEEISSYAMLSKCVEDTFGISIREAIVTSNTDKLLSQHKIFKQGNGWKITPDITVELDANLSKAHQLELKVKEAWFLDIKERFVEYDDKQLSILWGCLQKYLCFVFEQHGMQALKLLNPQAKINGEDSRSLYTVVEKVASESENWVTEVVLTEAINLFFNNYTPEKVEYLAQLADASFTSYAVTADKETTDYLKTGYKDFDLFLDTNFIFGILDLHNNSEDTAAKEILEEKRKNKLPYHLCYHPETLDEFKRAFNNKAKLIKGTNWTKETSRIALTIKEISPIERLFHEKNLEEEIEPTVFLEKYDHIDKILKDIGLNEYIPPYSANPSDEEKVQVEEDIDAYQKFFEENPRRKAKTYLKFKHDIVVLRDVRRLNNKKNSFLNSDAFFISSDYVLAKFESKYYKKRSEINFVVSPSVFLQLIRPFLSSDYNSNKRFIDTFSIPEFRAFNIDYSSTRSTALQIINDTFHGVSIETKVKVLRDQVLMEKLEKSNENYQQQVEIIENRIATENKLLEQQKQESEEALEKAREENTTINIRVQFVEEELNRTKEELEKTRLSVKYKEDVSIWEKKKDAYIISEKDKLTSHFLGCTKKFWWAFVYAVIAVIIIPLVFKIDFPENYKWLYYSLIIVGYLFLAVFLFWRVFLVTNEQKDRIREGYKWVMTLGLKGQKQKLLNTFDTKLARQFEDENPRPSPSNL